jgi:hypothetical protein
MDRIPRPAARAALALALLRAACAPQRARLPGPTATVEPGPRRETPARVEEVPLSKIQPGLEEGTLV